jgi:Ca2+-binding EF-hand superfamily protein
MTKIPLTLAVALLAAGTLAAAQEPGRQGGRGGFPGMRSPIAAALDANQDNTISGTEIDNASSALKALDKNNDGHLMGDELMPAMPPGRGREGMGMPGMREEGRGGNPDEPGETPATSPDELAAMLMSFDKNHDGQLTKNELPERLQGIFDRADADKNGKVTADEIKASARRTRQLNEIGGREGFGREGGGREGREGGRGPGGMDLLMGALDLNKDGMLGADEMAAAPKSLRTLDRNNDGQLTADEFRQGGRIG